MRTIKEPEIRKGEILDAAEKLFAVKGYETATINDILDAVQIAKGTFYYHFKSKEDVLDALIERISGRFLSAAKKIAGNKNIPVFERLLKTFMSIIAGSGTDGKLNDHIHKPQNALMHQKTHELMLKGIPPILTGIIEDGIREKLFDTPYPYESVEMAIAQVIMVFDDDYMSGLPQKEQMKRIKAFIFNMERVFGAAPGSFAPILKLFKPGEENTKK